MNQVHKVIWSRVKNCYIVVSEITKRVGRDNKASVTGIRPLRALLCAMVIAGCMLPADADAAPGLIHAGTGATASGDSSIAYGYSAQAKKDHSIAQGTGADAEEEYALAMGYKATAKGLQSLAIGRQANAKGANSIAAGAGAKGYAQDGVAIGNNAESGTADNKDPRIPTILSNNGVAVGNSAKASGGSSVSVGNDSIGNGPSSVAIGNAATANDVRTTAIGNNAHAAGAGSLSIGREASALTLENATSTNPLVTGDDEKLDKKGVMAIGDDAKASGTNSIALGTSAKAGDLYQDTNGGGSVSLTGSAKRITKLTSIRSVNNAVAVGTESSVQSDEDIAVGYRAATVKSKYHQLPGSGQVAIGSNSNTYGTRGDVAIGSGAETNIRVKNVDHTTGTVEKPDGQSVAIGSVAKAYGSQAVAVGADTRAIGNSSVAIGTDDIQLDRTRLQSLLPGLANNENLNNKAPSDATLGSAALGDKPYYVKTASIGTASVALGAMSQAAGDASMAMGLNALAEGDASTAIGPLARSKGKNSIAMGVSAQAAGGKGNTAIGHEAKVESAAGDGNIAFGSSASVKDGAGHVVIGKNASADTVNGYGIAIGSSASIGIGAAAGAAAIGTGSRVEGSGIAFGRQAKVTASSTESGIAIGTESSVDGAQKGTAIGYKAKVLSSGDDSGLAIGTESSAGGNEGSIALGKKASVDSSTNAGGVAIGLNASAKGISSIVIGKDAKADDGNQAHVIAIGVGATATGTSQYSSVMGSAAKASREYSTVLGSNANSEVDGGVALGANSISNRHAGGSATGDVRTTNPYIPAGAGAAQVNAINATKGTTGAVSVGSDTVKRQIINVAAGTDDSDAVNVAQLKAAAANAAGSVSWTVQENYRDVNEVKNGSKVNFADGTNTTASVTKDASGKVTAVKYNLKKDVNLGTDGSLTIGNVKINNTGINAGNKQITNVASGGDVVTNAANIGDINRIVTAKDKYITKGKATYQTNGDGTAALTGTNNLTAKITGLKNNYVTTGSVSNDGKTLTLERNDTGKVNVDLSKIFTEVAKEDYHLVANPEAGSQGKYKADSSGNMVLTVANDKGDKKQVTLTDIASKAQQNTNTTNITNINNTIEKGLNFGGDSGADINKKLGEKLEIKGGASADLTDGNIGVVSDGAKLNVKLKKDVNLGADGSLTINGKTYINKNGLNANNQKITNVEKGTAGTDAVNVDQLNAAIGGTAKATTVKAKDANVTVTEGLSTETGGKEYTVGLGDKVTLGTADKKIVVDGTSGKITAGSKVTIDGTTGDIQAGTVKVTGAGTVNELTNRTWDIDNPTVVHGQAATEDQLKTVSDGVKTNKTNITNINNTIAKGLNFGGDSGAVINKKLGEKLEIKGGASADLTDDNIGVVSDGAKLNVKLKKDVDLGPNGSLTINGKTYVNKDGLNANGQKITNVADGTVNSDAVNFGQLKDAVAAGKTILKDGKNTTVEGEGTVANPYKVNVNDDLVLGKKGADGKDGSIGVNGKDGSAVVINGKDGSIGLNGKDGANGLTIKGGDGKPGVDGTNITRLIIEEKNGKQHDIATLDDGMKYGGDTGDVIKKKLNGQVNVVGGIGDEGKLTTDDNIGVVSDGSNNLKVRLAKNINLGPDGSLTINGKTYVNKDGLNANGQKITNVADGTVNSDAVNFGQLKDAVAAGKTILKDGKNTTVEGEGTVANPYKVNVNDDLVLGRKGADGKDGSIGVNGKDGSSVVIHGKDGISIKGKDGKDGVTLKAKDGANGTEGQIGLTGPAGKDGKSTHADIGVNAGPASLDPAKNLSATEMTRLYYVDEKGDHQVATMDDGMKFAGNTGLAIKKLNSTMTIRGTGTKADTEYDPSNIKTMVDADGNMIVGLDKNLKADSVGINGKDGRDGATIKGGDGKPGVDGTNITRLIIEEKNGKQHDIATLDDGMKYGGDTGAVIKKKLNEQVNVVGGITNKDELTTDDNIGVVSDGTNNLKVRLAKDLKGLNSVTAGNTVMNNDGLTIKNGPKIVAAGIDAGGKKITNVAAGEADTDAVNFSQLKNQGSEIVNKGFGIKAEDGNEVKKKLGETVDVVGDGKNISTRVEGGRVKVALKDDISLNSVTTGRTKMDTNGLTIQDGSGNTAVTVNKDGLKIKDGPSVTKSGIDAGGKKITNVAAGEADTDAVNFSQLKKAAASATTKVADGKNTTVTSEDNADGSKTYHVNLNDDITLGTDSSKQISIKGSEGTIKAGQVTVNGTAGTVNGLTNKTWDPNHITSGQAATEDQLKVVSGQAGKHSSVTAGSNISVTTGTNANGGTEYKVAVVDTPTFKTVTTGNTVMSNNGLTIKNGPSITQTGVDAGGKRITNVAAGKADTDAVNVGQLKQIGGAINKVDNRINRVGAGAAALAALHPLDFDPDDKWDFTLGYGNYKDAHSLALGAFYRPNEDTMISVGGSIGGGENMVNAGLSMKLGQGNHVSTSKVAMAKEIKDLRAELENVKGALLKVADGRPLDSMDMDKMQLFPDVPENHWAYDYVATLAGNGVIVGYPDGQFGGDRMMTRYEMAALIYRAMQNGAAADDRMARALKEFEPELERIRVDTISKHKDGTPDIQRVRVIKGRG